MQITPAILIDNKTEFKEILDSFSFAESIDIDIIRPPFVDNQTVAVEDIIDLIDFNNKCIGFHFMVTNPKQDLINLYNMGFDNKNLRIYLHQESEIDFLDEFKWPQKWTKGIAVKLESQFKSIDFYRGFDEVQLMSIITGKQGNKFNPDVLTKAAMLKDLGFDKEISIDGGVNLETIKLIKDMGISRVSVGSYFQDSNNPYFAYKSMDDLINK